MTEDDGSSGESLYLRGDYEEAVAAWERSEKGTEGFEHHYWKGVALRKLGRNEEAVCALEKALSLNPESADAWRNHAVALNQLDRGADALKSCQKALAIDPDNPRTWIVRGFALHILGRFEEAVESYARAIELNPLDRTGGGPGTIEELP